jgi:hypothetical protein
VGEMEFVEGSERIKTPDILLSQFIEAAVISTDKKKRKGKQVVEVEGISPERDLSLMCCNEDIHLEYKVFV